MTVGTAGSYSEALGKGSATYSYWVCQPEGVCSNIVTLAF